MVGWSTEATLGILPSPLMPQKEKLQSRNCAGQVRGMGPVFLKVRQRRVPELPGRPALKQLAKVWVADGRVAGDSAPVHVVL